MWHIAGEEKLIIIIILLAFALKSFSSFLDYKQPEYYFYISLES